jgi:hypothetical protein
MRGEDTKGKGWREEEREGIRRAGKGRREREGMLGEGGEGNGWQGGEGARERRGGKGMEKEGISTPKHTNQTTPMITSAVSPRKA